MKTYTPAYQALTEYQYEAICKRLHMLEAEREMIEGARVPAEADPLLLPGMTASHSGRGILTAFRKAKGRALSSDAIAAAMTASLGRFEPVSIQSARVAICQLRQILDPTKAAIRTVRGIGYILEAKE